MDRVREAIPGRLILKLRDWLAFSPAVHSTTNDHQLSGFCVVTTLHGHKTAEPLVAFPVPLNNRMKHLLLENPPLLSTDVNIHAPLPLHFQKPLEAQRQAIAIRPIDSFRGHGQI